MATFFSRLAKIEKDKNGHLYNRKSDFRVEYSILEELECSMTVSRKTESKWGCCLGFFGGLYMCVLWGEGCGVGFFTVISFV